MNFLDRAGFNSSYFRRDVESSVNSLTPPPGAFYLGNTTFLGQETTQERQALYGQLVNSYKWTDKVEISNKKKARNI